MQIRRDVEIGSELPAIDGNQDLVDVVEKFPAAIHQPDERYANATHLGKPACFGEDTTANIQFAPQGCMKALGCFGVRKR
jgi:hypothetical protein